MKIKELFKQVNKEDMFLSFIRRYDIIESYDHRASVAQEVEVYKYFKNKLFDFVDRVSNAKDVDLDSLCFVIDVNALEYEDKQKKKFEVFSVDKSEYLKIKDSNFKLWGEKDKCIERFSLFMVDIEKLANYEISQKSIDTYGKEAVVAAICSEKRSFNFEKDTDAKEELIKSLEKAADIKDEECYSAREVFKELKKDLFNKTKDEDLKKYWKAEDEFNKKTKNIKQKWFTSELENNQKIMIEFMK